MILAYNIINDEKYHNICVSISGGSDSDIMLDIIERVRNFEDSENHKITYVWFNTGLEYQATKNHLDFLEKKYGIKIERINPWQIKGCKSIVTSCKEHGQPFVSKHVSEMLHRIQRKGFDFRNDGFCDFDTLMKKYPNAKSALSFWCNLNKTSSLNISGFAWAKEFIVSNPPTFMISGKCCTYAKKNVAKAYNNTVKNDLELIGVRKSEGGIRSKKYKNCYSIKTSGSDDYRPLFWYTDKDKLDYENAFGVEHSKCYSKYGFKRTGCACCPFGFLGGRLFEELEATKQFEPNLYKAVANVFGDSYEYTMKFEEYRKAMKAKYGSYKHFLEMKANGEIAEDSTD